MSFQKFCLLLIAAAVIDFSLLEQKKKKTAAAISEIPEQTDVHAAFRRRPSYAHTSMQQ